MNPTGILLIVAGIWVATQVLGGDALGRLKLVHSYQLIPGGQYQLIKPAGENPPSTSLPGPSIAGGVAGFQ